MRMLAPPLACVCVFSVIFDQALDDSNYVLIREYPRAVIIFNSFVEISPLLNPDSKLIMLKYIVF